MAMSSHNQDVCIVGLGAVTPVGASAPESAAAVRAGVSTFTEYPSVLDRQGEAFVVAKAPSLEDELSPEDRFGRLTVQAAQEALSPLKGLSQASKRVTAIVGLPSTRPGLSPDLAEILAEQLATLKETCVLEPRFMAHGHAAGLMALDAGSQLLREGTAVFVLVGGVESYLNADTLEWVEDCDQLHNSVNAWGFVPGEAAGFCLLCTGETAKRNGLPVLGRVLATATTQETNLIKTETVCTGKGLTQAVTQVLQSVASEPRPLDYAICDQNGEAYRADEFGFLLVRTSHRFKQGSLFETPADCWGDVGAASGPLFVTLAVFAARKGYSAGPCSLLCTSAEGGERSVALIRFDGARRSGI